MSRLRWSASPVWLTTLPSARTTSLPHLIYYFFIIYFDKTVLVRPNSLVTLNSLLSPFVSCLQNNTAALQQPIPSPNLLVPTPPIPPCVHLQLVQWSRRFRREGSHVTAGFTSELAPDRKQNNNVVNGSCRHRKRTHRSPTAQVCFECRWFKSRSSLWVDTLLFLTMLCPTVWSRVAETALPKNHLQLITIVLWTSPTSGCLGMSARSQYLAFKVPQITDYPQADRGVGGSTILATAYRWLQLTHTPK